MGTNGDIPTLIVSHFSSPSLSRSTYPCRFLFWAILVRFNVLLMISTPSSMTGVGKTSFVHTVCHDQPLSSPPPVTVGCHIEIKVGFIH